MSVTRFDSAPGSMMRARLVNWSGTGATAWTLTTAASPAAKVPSPQLTHPACTLHAPRVLLTEITCSSGGKQSDNSTEAALAEPALVTVRTRENG